MPKQATALPLSLPAARGGTPLYRWFYEELRSAILEGRLKPAARLPATRDLAHQYGLSRSTVVAAFEQLKSEGYVEGKIGAGTYVSEVLPDELLQVGRSAPAGTAHTKRVRWSAYARRLKLFTAGALGRTRAFRANQAALDAFPVSLWAQAAARRLRRPPARWLPRGDHLAYRLLRHAVREHVHRSRRATCSAARRSHSLIFEDDYDSEYRYSGRPVPALQGLDRTGSVIYAGSFNEVLFPALRLAYLVVPANMVDRFAAAQSIGMRYAPLLDQA